VMDGTNLGTKHEALTLAAGWGWPTFPLAAGAKLPALPRCPGAVDMDGHRLAGAALAEHAADCTNGGHGFLDATTCPERVVSWWDANPDANIGLRTGAPSGTVVLDVDPGGMRTVRDLIAELGPLPKTFVVFTPRGEHVYFRHPGGRVPCSAQKLGPGLDVRGDGGYVVAGGSTVAGVTYAWREDPWPGPPDLPALPPAWVKRLTTGMVRTFAQPALPARTDLATWVLSAIRGEVAAVAEATPGGRNHRLNAAAFRLGQLVAAGVADEERARAALLAAAQRCGLGPSEADRTIRSGLTAGRAEPAALPEAAA
jgi:putative DNA primase/helicase